MRVSGSVDADDLAQRAWAEIWTKPQTRATNAAALELVARVLALQPEHAEALGVAAYAYARAATYGWGMPREEALEKGIAAGERSIAIDPDNADALYALGFVYYAAGQTARTQGLMRQCIEVNRNHAPAYFFYGISLIRLGRPRDAIEWVQRAFKLSPRDPLRSVWYAAIARAEMLIGEDARAVDTALEGVAANARHSHNFAVLAAAYAHLGRMVEARGAVATLREVQPGVTLEQYQRQVAGTDPVAIKIHVRLLEGLRLAGLPSDV